MQLTCSKTMAALPSEAEIRNKPESLCAVEWSQRMFDRARKESCGKCVLCREGTLQIFTLLSQATEGKGEADDLELLVELSLQINANANCEMARVAAANLLLAIERYRDEWEMHLKRKRCPALVCKKYFTTHILPEVCQGCGACAGVCPAGAIDGGTGLIHRIEEEKCTRCGACALVCKANAITKAGAVKPKTPEKPVPVGSWESNAGRRRRR